MLDDRVLASIAEDAATRAGACIAEMRAQGAVSVETKRDGRELVSAADLASDALIRRVLREATPDTQYLSEEGEQADIDWTRPVWIVDPLDGTVNYLYGHAHVGVSIAYVVGGEVRVGVVHAPLQRETFVAVRGRGATRNGVGLPSVAARPLRDALVGTGFPHGHDGLPAIFRRLVRVRERCRDVRRLASPALDICWVADGRLDAAYETLAPWDVAAAGLVAREAGVVRGRYAAAGRDLPEEVDGTDVAYARPGLSEELLAVLRDAAPASDALRSLAARFEAASARYAALNGIDRDDDWYVLKLQEEVGELTQAWIRSTGRGRRTELSRDQLRSHLADEAADVLGHVLLFAQRHQLDLEAAVKRKWRFEP